MGGFIVQNDFTHGEFTPLLSARQDLAIYMKGAKKLRNVFVIPQGGARRRPGLKYITPLESDIDKTKIIRFDYSEDTQYLLIFSASEIKIYHNDALVATKSSPWTADHINELKATQSNNLMIISHPDYTPRFLVRGASHSSWTLGAITFKHVPVYDFAKNYNAVIFTLSATSVGAGKTLTASSALFNADYVGGTFFGPGATVDSSVGYARITNVVSSTVVDIDIISEFQSTTILGDDAILTEPAWSATRGWPATCTFYENRLVFGGSKSLPQTLFFSRIGDFYDFEIGTGRDDDAIIVTMATDSLNKIRHLVSNRSLQIFTTDAEFAPPQLDNSPLTPNTISVRLQTRNGSTDVEPVELDNTTFYVRRGGKAVMAFVFRNDTQSYLSEEASILCPHLIVNPIDSAVLKGSTTESANFMFLVNSDGTLFTYQTLRSENVSAGTLSDTKGEFKRIAEVGDNIYFLIKRTINGNDVNYLEKLDFNLYTDSTYTNTYGTPTKTITGLSHLEGETVRVRGDGYVLETHVVESGQIILKEEVSNVEVGINFNSLIQTNPVVIEGQRGIMTYKIKRVIRAFIQYYESLGIYVHDSADSSVLIPYEEFGDEVLDQPPETKTGIKEQVLMDWHREATLTLTQEDPLPMTILGIGYEIQA